MGELNDYILIHVSCQYFSKLGLRELITDKHGPEGPGYTRSNKNNNAIYDIWGSPGLVVNSCIYLPVNDGLKSDHRLIWVKISLANALGDNNIPKKKHRPTNSASIIRLESRNTSPRPDILPDNITYLLGLEHLRITKTFLPCLKLSPCMKKLTKSYSRQDQNPTPASDVST